MSAQLKRCLVTGAAGFVGAGLTVTMAERGFHVTGSIRASEGYGASDGWFESGDIDGNTDWSAALVDKDTVIHLANCAHLSLDTKVARNIQTVNEDGTLNLAKQASISGVQRFIYLSSIKVNGESTTDKPFCFDDNPAPEDAYGHSKWNAEQALSALCRKSTMELVIIRPPLVYGLGVKGNMRKLSSAIDRGYLFPFGAFKNRRDLIGLRNLVDLIIVCISHPRAANETFLCSDNHAVSTPELIRYIARAKGKNARLLNVPQSILKLGSYIAGREGTYQRLAGNLQVDIRHTQNTLGWRPPYSLEEEMQWAFGPHPNPLPMGEGTGSAL